MKNIMEQPGFGRETFALTASIMAAITLVCFTPQMKAAGETNTTVQAEQQPQETGSALPNLFKYGPFELRPYFLASMVFDDNIRISSANQLSDLTWTLAPGLLIGAGDYRTGNGSLLSLDYQPNIILYTKHGTYNSVDHWVNFTAKKAWDKLQLTLGQSLQSGSGGVTESLNRMERNIYLTTLRVLYNYSEKTSFEINGSQSVNDWQEVDNQALINYNEWIGQTWMNYQITAKTKLGLGGIFGWRDVAGSPNQTYQQILLRAIYFLTEKTRLTAGLGPQFEQYQGGGSTGPTFVFSLGGSYQPWERTTFTLEAYQRDQNSVVVQNQNYISTGFRASAQHRFLEKFTATLSGGYENAKYKSIEAAGVVQTPGRTDGVYFVSPALDYNITERWYVGVFYQYRANDSSDPQYKYTDNQVGLRSSYRF